ncbi:MAG: hypothetical protein HZA49_05655 [Planctomycetes bacterium]|nr:hypothetical protein [Planctomycetota bacterium]
MRGEGNVYQSTGPFLPGAWFSNPDVKPLEYNPALALKILKDERWEMRDDRVLEKDGVQFRFTLLVDPKERVTGTIAKIIYQDLYKIGIRCDIKTYDHSNQDKELVQQAGAAVISIKISAELEPNWHSNKQQRDGKLWPYTNPAIDKLFEQANTIQDIDQRKELYHRLHRLVYEEQSGTFLYCLPNLCAISRRFSNTDRFFSAAMPFYTIKEWKISKGHNPSLNGIPSEGPAPFSKGE